MKKKPATDAWQVVLDFQKEILADKPLRQLLEEVRMMRFKIRPLSGDVLALNLTDYDFLQTLWKLGKLDEFFHSHYEQMKPNDRKVFFDLFDELHGRFEKQLNGLDILQEKKGENSPEVEMEIFKEYPSRKSLN